MNDLNIGDRVEVVNISKDDFILSDLVHIKKGMRGFVLAVGKGYAPIYVEFDEKINSTYGSNSLGKADHCWWMENRNLKKIEEKDKGDRRRKMSGVIMHQKILKALREEIGVDVDEEFEVCIADDGQESQKSRWTCKFINALGLYGFHVFVIKKRNEFFISNAWKELAINFDKFEFKKKSNTSKR